MKRLTRKKEELVAALEKLSPKEKEELKTTFHTFCSGTGRRDIKIQTGDAFYEWLIRLASDPQFERFLCNELNVPTPDDVIMGIAKRANFWARIAVGLSILVPLLLWWLSNRLDS